MSRSIPLSACILAATAAIVVAGTKFTSTWKAPEAAQVRFAGQKVATLVLTKDDSLRVSGEEGLARELTARGVQATPAYRLIPKEELTDASKARGWFERANVAGVVAMRPVSMENRRTYVPGAWGGPPYNSLWGYYGYGWGTLYDPGFVRDDTVVVIETLIYSVPMDKLLWASVTESTNPKNAAKLLAELVKETAKQMQKQGLTRAGAT